MHNSLDRMVSVTTREWQFCMLKHLVDKRDSRRMVRVDRKSTVTQNTTLYHSNHVEQKCRMHNMPNLEPDELHHQNATSGFSLSAKNKTLMRQWEQTRVVTRHFLPRHEPQ